MTGLMEPLMLRNTPLRVNTLREKHRLLSSKIADKTEPVFQSRRIRVVTRVRPVHGHRNNHNHSRRTKFHLLPKEVQSPHSKSLSKVPEEENGSDVIQNTGTMDTVHSSSSSEDLQNVHSQESEFSSLESSEKEKDTQSPPESPARKLFLPGSLYGKSMSPNPHKTSTPLCHQVLPEPSSRDSTPVTRNTQTGEETRFFPRSEQDEEIVFESIVVEQSEIENNEKHKYDMDLILDAKASQAKLFQNVATDAIKKEVLKGYNSAIVTYGASNSGKSFSLFGNRVDKRDDHIKVDDGIFQRSVSELLEAKRRGKTSMSLTEGKEVHLEMAICEIAGQMLRDLSVDSECVKNNAVGTDHSVPKLQAAPVVSLGQARRLLQQALDRHAVGAHMFVTFHVRIGMDKIAKLSLCDLASSSQNDDPIQSIHNDEHEATTHEDLKVLERVVNTLAKYDDTKSKMYARRFSTNNLIPYADSQLTQMLREALGGNCSTTILACIDPQDDISKTISTLQFAQQCRTIHCHYKQNHLPQNLQRPSSTPFKTPHKKPAEQREESSIRKENKRLNGLLSRYRRHFHRSNKGGEISNLSLINSKDDGFSLSSISTKSSSRREQWALAKNLKAKIDKARQEAQQARSNNMKMMERMESLRSRTKGLAKKDTESPPVQIVTTPQSDTKQMPYLQIITTPQSNNKDLVMSVELPHEEEGHHENEAEEVATFESISNTATTSLASSSTEASIATPLQLSSDLVNEKMMLESEVTNLREEKMNLEAKMASLEQEYAAKRRTLKREILNLEATRNMMKLEASRPVIYAESDVETTPIKTLKVELEQVQRQTQASEDAHKLELEEIKKQNDVLKHEMAELRGQVVANSPLKPLQMDAGLETKRGGLQNRVSILSSKVLDMAWGQKALPDSEDLKDENSTSGLPANLPKPKTKRRLASWSRRSKRKGQDSGSTTSEEGSASSVTRGPPKQVSCVVSQVSSLNDDRDSVESSLQRAASTAEKKASPSLVISNMDSLKECSSVGGCVACQSGGPFPGKPKQVEFYLPKLSIVCTCGKRSTASTKEVEDPLALSNILRDWQVEFLAHLDIHDADHFVRIANGKMKRLSRMLRQYRKDHKLPSMGNKSCSVALHIWARTCTAVIKATEETEAGSPVQRNVLEYHVRKEKSTSISAGQLASVSENEPLPSVKEEEEDTFSDASSWLTNEI